jgi:hypothetical protein
MKVTIPIKTPKRSNNNNDNDLEKVCRGCVTSTPDKDPNTWKPQPYLKKVVEEAIRQNPSLESEPAPKKDKMERKWIKKIDSY